MPFLFFITLFFAAIGWASPPPGTYELYDGTGKRTGTVVSKIEDSIYNEQPTTMVEVKTDIEWPQVSGKYLFSEKDTAHIQKDGLVYFQRETDDNGKKTRVTGERRGPNLFLFVKGDGKNVSTAIPFSSFDMTEFEMELPSSKFAQLKLGESAALRVFMVEALKPILVSRNVYDKAAFPRLKKKVQALVATTLINSKVTTSWFDAKTHDLLQEEGSNHLMSLSGE